MPRNYQRKTTRQSWSVKGMRTAIMAVMKKQMGYMKASKEYNVPQTTLGRRVSQFRKNPDMKLHVQNVLVLLNQCSKEEDLVGYVLHMENRMFGLTGTELRQLAFQLAEKNKIKHYFDQLHGMAGYDWLQGFMKRHPTLSLRKPEATSKARAMGFNRVAVNAFFDLLCDVVDSRSLDATRIWNCDETGDSSVPKSLSKIIACKGKKQVGALTSAERGQLVTSVIACSASGQYMPPLMIFPRVRMKPELMNGAPPGAWAECHPSGWIQAHLFVAWLQKFIVFTGAKKESSVLLILDGHATHTKNIELIDLARDNGVIMLCLPPHCTHRMQPLDVSFMKPLSTYYDHEIRKWLRSHPGRVVTQFQITEIFGGAYMKAATMPVAINGFKKCGIWPVDRHVFTDDDFLAAAATDIKENDAPTSTSVAQVTTFSAPQPSTSTAPQPTAPSAPQPSTSSAPQPSTSTAPTQP